MSIKRTDGINKKQPTGKIDKNRKQPEQKLSMGTHGARQVLRVMPQQLFQKLTKADQDIIRQAERIARRELRRAKQQITKSVVVKESIIKSQTSNPAVVNFSDPYAVVLELARIANGMDATKNPQVVLMLSETIAQMLRDIEKQKESKAEQQQEEQEQDEQIRKFRAQQRQRKKHLRRIAKDNRLRLEHLKRKTS